MQLKDLVFDVEQTVGNNFFAINVCESQKWVNGVITDVVDGWKVTIVMPEKGYEKAVVKVAQKPDDRILNSKNCLVEFDNLEVVLYSLNDRVCVSFKADAVRPKPKVKVES